MALWSYQIQIRGELADGILTEVLSEMQHAAATVEPARTTLSITLADQAALLGVLDRLHGLGLQVSELRRLPMEGAAVKAAAERSSLVRPVRTSSSDD